jgi:Cu/Zn superoxide dismutase
MKRRVMTVLAILFGILPALGFGAGARAEGVTTTFSVLSDNDSGITGIATITDLGGGTLNVEVRVNGAGATPRPLHIHDGSCVALNTTVPSIPLAPVVDGVSVSQIDATMEQLLATPHAVHMHKSAEELTVYVACSDIKLVAPATIEAGAATTLDVRSDNDSGISGTATVTDLGNSRVRVEVRVDGAGSTPRPLHIHDGSCAALNTTIPSIPLAPITNGVSTTDIEATMQQLAATPHAIHMHKSPEELTVYVACADIVLPSVGERYTVVRGDSLSSIAERLYGDQFAWPRLFDANRQQITNPNLLFAGQVLAVPR